MGENRQPDEAPSPWTKEQMSKLRMQLITGETPMTTPNTGRFQKGKSGNPKGRPRKATAVALLPASGSLHSITLDEARRTIQVREGEHSSQMPVAQALFKAQLSTALKGNAHAQKHALERIDRAQRIEAAEVEREAAYWREYISHTTQQIADAKARGEPEPPILPHPEDVIIEPGEHVRFAGPWDEDSHALWLQAVKLRDVQMLQHALDLRAWPNNAKLFSDDGPGFAYIMAERLNKALPKRMRIAESEFEYRIDFLSRHSKRVLLRRAYQGWLQIGSRRRRGVLSRPFGPAMQLDMVIDEYLVAVRDGKVDTGNHLDPLFAECLERIKKAGIRLRAA